MTKTRHKCQKPVAPHVLNLTFEIESSSEDLWWGWCPECGYRDLLTTWRIEQAGGAEIHCPQGAKDSIGVFVLSPPEESSSRMEALAARLKNG